MKPHRLYFQPDGRVQTVHDDDALDFLFRTQIGRPAIRRASNVEPTIGCGWRYDLSPLGINFQGATAFTRKTALEEEVEHVERLLSRNEIQ